MTTTSAKDGSFSFAKVPYGKWIVREIEQPKGFVLDEKAYEVNISKAEQVVEIEIVNEYVHGNIRLTKMDAEYPDNKLMLLSARNFLCMIPEYRQSMATS